MTDKVKIQVIKRSSYNHDDSSKVFLLAILCPFILSFAISYVASGLASNWGVEAEVITSNIWFNLIVSLLSLALYIAIWWGYNKSKDIHVSATKLNKKIKWHTYFILIAVAIIMVFGSQYLVQAFDNLLGGMGYPLDSGIGGVEPTSVGTYIYCIFALALIPAFCEELLFRGVIFNGLRQKFNSVGAVLISAGMFALAHQNLQQIVYPFIFGCVLAVVALRTGSSFAAMIVHFTNNLIVVTMAYISNVTGFSFSLQNTWWFYLVAVGCGIAAFGLCFIIDKFYFKHKNHEEVVKKQESLSKYFWLALLVGVIMYIISVVTTVMIPANPT